MKSLLRLKLLETFEWKETRPKKVEQSDFPKEICLFLNSKRITIFFSLSFAALIR